MQDCKTGLKIHIPALDVRLKKSVDTIHYPAEESAIEGLGHGVPHISGLIHCISSDYGLATCYYTVRGQRLLQLLCSYTQQNCG